VAVSKTFWLTWAIIEPGRSELMPVIMTPGMTVPVLTSKGWPGVRVPGSVHSLSAPPCSLAREKNASLSLSAAGL